MIHKETLPESFDFGVPSVEMIGVGSKGMDKTAMVKRASAFDDILEDLVAKPNRTYLHVITTGASEFYGPNLNCVAAGTPVVTMHGKYRIEDVALGMYVCGGVGQWQKVIKIMQQEYTGTMVRVRIQSDICLLTADHPVAATLATEPEELDAFAMNPTYIPASELTTAHRLVIPGATPTSKSIFPEILQITTHVEENPVVVYNLEVENIHAYSIPFLTHNCDAWPETSHDVVFVHPEDPEHTHEVLDGGLLKYHDDEYMRNGAVYQEHKTKKQGIDPSGEVIAARYNVPMHRGELIIAVDTEKWAPRLQRKAQGQDIYLSIGAEVPRDLCFVGGTLVNTPEGLQNIEDITKHSYILNNDNTPDKVVACSKSTSTALTDIGLCGIGSQLKCTPNHPMLACRGNNSESADTSLDWINAADLHVGDYLVYRRHTGNVTTLNKDVAFLAGCYAATGELLVDADPDTHKLDIAGFRLTGNSAMLDEIGKYINNIKDSDSISWYQEPAVDMDDSNAALLTVYYPELGRKLMELCGEQCGGISQFMFNLDSDSLTNVVRGWLYCSGVIQASTQIIEIHGRLERLHELRALCLELGIAARFGASGALEIADIDNKLGITCKWLSGKPNQACIDIANSIKFDADYAYMRITSICTYETFEVPVYNIEVENSHTYQACGVVVHNCAICGRSAKTMKEHCEHFTKMRGQLLDSGTKCYVINDSPHFYDISGVDVPADRIAFVLQKVASGETVKEASLTASYEYGMRQPMLLTKAAMVLDKLSTMQKEISAMVDDGDADVYMENSEAQKDFLQDVENYSADEVIDSCNRKGLLLSPGMLFKLLGHECKEPDGQLLSVCDDTCCGDCSNILQELMESEDRNEILLDGAFDSHFPPDIRLDAILDKYMPEFGCTKPAISAKIVRIYITERPPRQVQHKEASFNKQAQQVLRNTYARYLISFGERNDASTCYNALRTCTQFI